MEITYLGHSSFRVKTKSASFVTDPYDPAVVGLKFPKLSADIVTISHDHADHNNAALVKNVRKVIGGPGEYEILGISIIGIQTYHDKKNGAERGKNTVYVFEAEGLRLVHLGDLGHLLNESQIENIGTVDILMVPCGGGYTIGPSEAVQVVHDLEPKIIIPMHYKLPSLNMEVFEKLADLDLFLKELALPTEEAEKLTVKEMLQDEQKVVKFIAINV